MGRWEGGEQSDVGARLLAAVTHEGSFGEVALGWVVFICVGLMVVGLVGLLARGFSAAGRRRLQEEGPGGRAGRWLIFMSLILGVIGAASFVAAREDPGATGADPLVALGLIGVGVLLFVAGARATAGARRRARIHRYGVSGEARVRGMRRTRTAINRHSVFEFDLEVSGSSFAPLSVRHRDTIPMWVVRRVEQGTTVPVKVDPSSPTRVVFDWDRFDAAQERVF